MKKRHQTRAIRVGGVTIGGGSMLTVQSMTTTDTRDAKATVAQINKLAAAGCDIIRVAVPDTEAAQALPEIIGASHLPVVADIHFDYRLALKAIEAGVHKLRLNPGTIVNTARVKEVAKAAMEHGIPIRIGVNAGSLEKELLAQVEQGTMSLGSALAESALREARILEDCGMADIVISVKASRVPATIEANRILAEARDYPLHIGITEAGTARNAIIKSAAGLGVLLAEGIGDTLRVSISGPPLEEVLVGRKLLQAMELRGYGPEIISCPTCGRTKIDVAGLAEELERRIALDETLRRAACTVAIMGCSVNGPGEARAADIGFAGGREGGILFRKGEACGAITVEQAIDRLIEELRTITDETEQTDNR